MITKTGSTYRVLIYMSGPIEIAKQVLRKYCLKGLCVTIEPTTFIYTGCEETGFVVGLLNYPRFPSTCYKLNRQGYEIMNELLVATCQHSGLLVTPDDSTWISIRPENETTNVIKKHEEADYVPAR